MIDPTIEQVCSLYALLVSPANAPRTLYSHELERFNEILRRHVSPDPKPNPFEQLGSEIGQMCGEKRESYGNALGNSGDFLKIFWPVTVPPEDYNLVMLYARLFDKLMRIVHDEGAFGEDPWKDIAGYAIQQVYNQREAKQRSVKLSDDMEEAARILRGEAI